MSGTLIVSILVSYLPIAPSSRKPYPSLSFSFHFVFLSTCLSSSFFSTRFMVHFALGYEAWVYCTKSFSPV